MLGSIELALRRHAWQRDSCWLLSLSTALCPTRLQHLPPSWLSPSRLHPLPPTPIPKQVEFGEDPLHSSLDYLHYAARTAGQPPAYSSEAQAAVAAEERLHKERLARAHFARWVLHVDVLVAIGWRQSLADAFWQLLLVGCSVGHHLSTTTLAGTVARLARRWQRRPARACASGLCPRCLRRLLCLWRHVGAASVRRRAPRMPPTSTWGTSSRRSCRRCGPARRRPLPRSSALCRAWCVLRAMWHRRCMMCSRQRLCLRPAGQTGGCWAGICCGL